MKKNKSIIIFGSGRRTQQDILPALDYLKFPKNKIIIYAKNNKTIISRNHTYLVKSIKECTEINNDDLIYIAVSTASQIQVLEFVQKINTNSKISLLFQAIIFLPLLTVSFRRLHDVNRSGWWLVPILITSTFFIVSIWLIIWACTKSVDEIRNLVGKGAVHNSRRVSSCVTEIN